MDIIRRFEPIFGEWYAAGFLGAGSFGRVYSICRSKNGVTQYSALKYVSLPYDEGDITRLRANGLSDSAIRDYYTDMISSISSEVGVMEKLRGHPNVVRIEECKVFPKPGGIGYDAFIRMELLQSLTKRMAQAPMSAAETVKLGVDLCSALVYCRENGIIHRDVKPDNIFVAPNGDYKLGDFGIARKFDRSASFMSKKGTYSYMAPEVYNGERYGANCDVYSLGLVMYRLLNNGRLPFMPPYPAPITSSDNDAALVRRIKGDPIPHPICADRALASIVLKACAFDPAKRYRSAKEMLDALMLYADSAFKPTYVPPIIKETETAVDPPADDPNQIPNWNNNKVLLGLLIGVSAALTILFLLLTLIPDVFKKKTFSDVSDVQVDVSSPIAVEGWTPIPSDTPSPSFETVVPYDDTEWSDWYEELPAGINDRDYEIEKQTFYSKGLRETTSSTITDYLDGWVRYDTVTANSGYGPWSEWSTEKPESLNGRSIDTETRYRYKDLETTESPQSSLSGWDYDHTTYKWGDFGDWSDWTDTVLVGSDTREVKTKTQYSYSRRETKSSTSSSLSGWGQHIGYHVVPGEWSDDVYTATSTTEPQSTATMKVISIETWYNYYHVCCNRYSDGHLYVDSIECGVGGPHHHHTKKLNYALPKSNVQDQGNQQAYGGLGSGAPACECNFYIWIFEGYEYTYTYRTRTLTTWYDYERWSDYSPWSDNYVSENGDLHVITRTLYRCRDKQQIPTYHFVRWNSDWSDWTSSPITESDTRMVDKAVFYKYQDAVTETTYFFERWNWGEYTPNRITGTDEYKVRQKTFFRYRPRK